MNKSTLVGRWFRHRKWDIEKFFDGFSFCYWTALQWHDWVTCDLMADNPPGVHWYFWSRVANNYLVTDQAIASVLFLRKLQESNLRRKNQRKNDSLGTKK